MCGTAAERFETAGVGLVPTELVFGRGCRHSAGEWLPGAGGRLLLITTPGAMKRLGVLEDVLVSLTAAGCATTCETIVPGGPRTDEIDDLAAAARAHRADGLVALGGGTVIDATKATAAVVAAGGSCADVFGGATPVTGALPVIAIPSTAGTGSEMNRSAVLTDPGQGIRDGLRSDHLFPRTALVDPEISAMQPAELALRTGFDALSHAIESHVSPKARPETDRLAAVAIERLVGALRSLAAGRAGDAERDELARWAALMGVNLSLVGTCWPHRIDKAVCAVFPAISHPQSVAFFYPAWIEVSWPGAVAKFARLARALGPDGGPMADCEAAACCAERMAGFLDELGLAKPPSAFGVGRRDIPALRSRVAGDLSVNPVPPDSGVIDSILEASIP